VPDFSKKHLPSTRQRSNLVFFGAAGERFLVYSFFFKCENWLFTLLEKRKQLLFFALLFALSTPLFLMDMPLICGKPCRLAVSAAQAVQKLPGCSA